MTADVASTINVHAWQYPEVRIAVSSYKNIVEISIGSDIAVLLRREQAEELQAELHEVLHGNDKG